MTNLDARTPQLVRVTVVSSVDQFRRLAQELPSRPDAALEIGCSTGETTRRLAAASGRVLAVDVSQEMVARTRAAVASAAIAGTVTVLLLNGRDTPALAAHLASPDLIFVDVGGNAQLDTVAFQIRQCLRTFAPRTLVVRSAELAAFCALVAEVEPPSRSPLLARRSRGRSMSALESLMALVRSSNAKNRVFAARKLRRVASPAARERLSLLANDPDHRVRRIARLDQTREEGHRT